MRFLALQSGFKVQAWCRWSGIRSRPPLYTCCVLMQDTLLSQCSSPHWLMPITLNAFPYFSTGPGRPVILSHKINIIDVDSSKPVVVPIGANVTTIVNATVVITCPTKGSPQPTVTWKHDGRFIVPGRYQMNGTALMIREVRLDDAGRYECTALNIFGRETESLLLAVTGNMITLYLKACLLL